MKNLKNYLSTLNERERWIAIGGGLCLILYLFYSVVYSPLSTRVSNKTNQLAEKIATLKWMKEQEQSLSTKIKKSVDNSQLLTVISDQLKSNNQLKFPFQLQQTSSGEIQLSFDDVPFKLFLNWLQKLDNEYAINIKQFNVDPTEKPGVTQLMIILTTA